MSPMTKREPAFPLAQGLKLGSRITRKRPVNFGDLTLRWKSIFDELVSDREPMISLREYKDVIFNMDAVIWKDGVIDLDCHEYSERRMLLKKYERPSALQFMKHPRSSFRKLIRQLTESQRLSYFHTTKEVLIFWDSRCFVNKYHWFVDALVRLAQIEDYDRYLLILPDISNEVDFYRESLRSFDIDPDSVAYFDGSQDFRYRCRSLSFISTSIFAPGGCSESGIRKLRAALTRSISSAEFRKGIFVNRRPGHARNIVNHDELVNFLRAYDIETVYAEDFSYSEIVARVNSTNILLGVMGAGLTNMIFMREGCSVIELMPETCLTTLPDYWTGSYLSSTAGYYYYSLASACDLNYFFIPCKSVGVHQYPLRCNVYVDIRVLKGVFERYLL